MKIEQKITSTFVQAFVFIFVVVALFVGVITFFSMSQQARQLVKTASLTKSEYLSSYLASQKEIGITLAGASVFRDLLNESTTSAGYAIIKKKVDDRLTRTIRQDPKIDELFIVDKHAKIVSSSNPLRLNADVSQDDFFIQGKKGPYIKSIYLSPVTHNLAWGVSVPIIEDKTEAVIGIVIMRLQTKPLFNLVKSQSSLGSSAEVFVVDDTFSILTPSLYIDEKQVLEKKIGTENVKECFDNKKRKTIPDVKIYNDYRDVPILGTHAYIPETNWCLITKIDIGEIYSPIALLLGLIVGITIFGSYAFYRMSASLSKRITSPIENLYKGILEVQKGNLSHKVGTESADEIGILSRQFDSLIASVKQAQDSVEKKVKDQTQEIVQQTKNLQDQKKAILNILEDVERGKSQADKLASDLEKFELAAENANDQIIITDPNAIILFANKSTERITGFELAEIMGKKAGSKVLWGGEMPLEFYKKLWKTIKEDKKPILTEVHNRRKNGEEYVAKASISPILNKNGDVDYFVGIERDVTKEFEVDKMKTEFISLASHQLRTPLSATRWFAEMLLEGDMGALSDPQKEAVTNISSSNKRMIDLVNSLLNISRIESGRMIIDPKPTDINVLIRDVVKGLEKKLEEKKQKIILTVHPQLPLISLDEKLIHEVYLNLLTNAIKYSPDNTEIIVSISKKDTNLLSQISDSGFGIPIIQKDKIFQKFFRADNVVKKVTDGTGLGLYLVKSIIESSNGKIWFESKENEGTTFWFTLPISGMKAHAGEVELS